MPYPELPSEPVELIVGAEDAGLRLDSFLARRFYDHSRARLRRVINASGVKVDGQRTKAAYNVREGQRITIVLPDPPREGPEPEDIPLDILFEDEHLVAINKPAGMIVHPAKGHWQGTLTSALAYHFASLSSIGGPTRPGIVHRLDRETSGVIIVAKTDAAHLALARQFENRTTQKEYLAVVAGNPDRDRDIVNQPLGVHPYQREKMAIRAGHVTSRDAHTFYEVAERFRGFATMRVSPKTGRTHQIRVHLAHIGCPILCDRLYGGRSQITRGEIRGDDQEEIILERAALHASQIGLRHPATERNVQFQAPPPEDIATVIAELREWRA